MLQHSTILDSIYSINYISQLHLIYKDKLHSVAPIWDNRTQICTDPLVYIDMYYS